MKPEAHQGEKSIPNKIPRSKRKAKQRLKFSFPGQKSFPRKPCQSCFAPISTTKPRNVRENRVRLKATVRGLEVLRRKGRRSKRGSFSTSEVSPPAKLLKVFPRISFCRHKVLIPCLLSCSLVTFWKPESNIFPASRPQAEKGNPPIASFIKEAKNFKYRGNFRR